MTQFLKEWNKHFFKKICLNSTQLMLSTLTQGNVNQNHYHFTLRVTLKANKPGNNRSWCTQEDISALVLLVGTQSGVAAWKQCGGSWKDGQKWGTQNNGSAYPQEDTHLSVHSSFIQPSQRGNSPNIHQQRKAQTEVTCKHPEIKHNVEMEDSSVTEG